MVISDCRIVYFLRNDYYMCMYIAEPQTTDNILNYHITKFLKSINPPLKFVTFDYTLSHTSASVDSMMLYPLPKEGLNLNEKGLRFVVIMLSMSSSVSGVGIPSVSGSRKQLIPAKMATPPNTIKGNPSPKNLPVTGINAARIPPNLAAEEA